MKGVTIIVILSVVWSIIASIIEKKKAAAKKVSAAEKQPTVQTEWKANPASVKVESLRRRARAASIPSIEEKVQPAPKKQKGLQSIKPLHVPNCPLPPTTTNLKKVIPAAQLAKMLKSRRNIRTAIVLNEILSKPVSQRA